MSLTLAEAAALCGLDKSTVRRAVRSGRISGTRDDLGVWHVEPCELTRVFPPASAPTAAADALPRDALPQTASDVDRTSDALVAELRAVIADLRQERDRLLTIAERQSLPAPQQPITWWRRLRTSG
jgi:excisionase family DNA binding protein